MAGAGCRPSSPSADELREPRDHSGVDVTGSHGATPDFEERVQDKP